MSKILVTGGAGFIGYNISRILSEDKKNIITIIDDLSKGQIDEEMKTILDKDNINFIRLDLSNTNNLEKIDWSFEKIYHLAAVVGVGRVMDDPISTLRTNSLSTINILDAIAGSGRKPKLLFTSSCENYAGTINKFKYKIPTDESVPLCIEDIKNPRWSYACSKILGEIACYHYAKKFNFDTSIIRYHNIYGPRMGIQHVIPEFLIRLKKNQNEFHLYGGNQERSFCYVVDAAKMTINLMDKPDANGEIVNIGNDHDNIKIRKLARMICDGLRIDPKFIEHGAPEGSVKKRIPDLNLIKKMGCFEYNYPFRTGLKNTIAWYLNKY